MSVLGDFDMESLQPIYSSHEMFKQTILKQEFIFRKQVLELHRLYSIQKTLMKDIESNHLKCHLWRANAQCLAQEIKSPSDPAVKVGSIPPRTPDWLDGCKSKQHKFQEQSVLQLSSDQFVSEIENAFPNKGNTRTHCKRSLDFNSLQGGDIANPLELKLSLSLGVGNNRKEDANQNQFGKNTISNSLVVIDLDQSTDHRSDEDAKNAPYLGCSAPVTDCVIKPDSRVSATSDPFIPGNTEKGLFSKAAKSSPSMEEGECSQERNSLSEGFFDSNCHLQHHGWSTRKQLYFDLNQVQLDDSSCFSNDPMVAFPSTTNSSSELGELVDKNQSNFFPPVIHGEDVDVSKNTFNTLKQTNVIDVTLTNSNSKDHSTEVLVRDTELDRTCEDEATLRLSSAATPCEHLSEDLGCLHDPKSSYIVDKKLNSGKDGAEDNCSGHSEITIEDKHCGTTPTSAKSCPMDGNDSSSGKTAESGIEYGSSNKCGSDPLLGTRTESQDVRTLTGDQDQTSTGGSQLKHNCYNQKEESGEVDSFIQTAAESLIEISLWNPASYQHCSTPEPDKMENEDELPLCSSDSFELIALRLTESSVEDSCVSSKPVEAIDSDRKDCSFKLRRGRRLKDFRKDILPSLACLSRHEIREDINILQGVLRSREYKKMRAKKAKGETWISPVRSKRSRLNHVGRRNFR